MSLVTLVNIILRQRRLIFALSLAGLLIAIAAYFLPARSYVAESTLVPRSATPVSAAAGLAAQFGVSVPAAASTDAPQLYVELVGSKGFLRDVALERYKLASGRTGTVAQLYEIKEKTEDATLRRSLKRLKEDINAAYEPGAGIIVVTTKAPWPELAVALNKRALALVTEFNLQKRQSQATAERQFTGERLQEAKQELTAAEQNLEAFLQRNRTYQSSPGLVFQAERLQRRVDLMQEVYVTLAQSHERARIEEVRNTPGFTVMEIPEHTVRPRFRSLAIFTILGLTAGALAGLFLAFAADYVRRGSHEPSPERAEFADLKLRAREDLRRFSPLRWLPSRSRTR